MTSRHDSRNNAEHSAEKAAATHSHSRNTPARTHSHAQSAQRNHAEGSTVQGGAVRYPDGAALARPLDLPRNVRTGLAVALVAAAIIGGAVLFTFFDKVLGGPAREQEALEQNLAKDVALDLPRIGALMNLSDADIMTTLSAGGATLYEKVPLGTSPSEFELIKLPADVTLADAGAMYLAGVENLSPSGAAQLLNGSWDLKVSREGGSTSIVVRYADFKSGNVEAAVQAAMNAEGIDAASIANSGIDDAGNTFASGEINVDGTVYDWRVSALELSEVYSVKGMPANAFYVGVRFTA